MLAIENGHKNIVELLLNKNVNLIDTNYHHRYTPLINAAIFGNYDIVSLLIQKHININHKTDTGNTALISAIINSHLSNNHIEVIKILLDNGASINIKNIFGDTALTITIAEKPNDILKLLLQKTHKIEKDDCNLALMYSGYKECLELTIKKGADINFKDNKGYIAIM